MLTEDQLVECLLTYFPGTYSLSVTELAEGEFLVTFNELELDGPSELVMTVEDLQARRAAARLDTSATLRAFNT